ncbi:hypothetical protein [Streptomyces sp. NPDC005799]|uniref:hypothetical protein n=1 Tax=Streptomyces sp. NPDC005799 TaxID=3154678 RepID=UPI003406D047
MPNVPVGEQSLGKKQANLLTAIMRGVPVLGRGKDFHALTDGDIRGALDRLPVGTDASRTGELNRLRPRLLDAVIGARTRQACYLRGLPSHGLEPLLHTVGEAVGAPLVLRVVYGASTEVPLRALSYVLPAVRMAARLAAAGHRALHLQVVLAASLGCPINGLTASAVAEETGLLARCLDRLLTLLIPHRYGIYGTQTPADVLAALEDLVRTLSPEKRARVLERLGGKGGATAKEQTLLYAAAHVLVHDRAAVPLELERGTAVPPDARVIDVGGLQERHFHDVRRLFATGAAQGPGALVLTRHAVPPYTMARGGDVGLREFLDGGSPCEPPAEAARRDLDLLWDELLPSDLRRVVDVRQEALR